MSAETREAVRLWVARAQSDWRSAEILAAHERCPAESVCFHVQQYVEKLLKAFLTLHGVEAPRTHDLRRLIQLCQPTAPQLAELADRADLLSTHGVRTRYPDDWREIEPAEMRDMMGLAREFAEILLPRLQEPE